MNSHTQDIKKQSEQMSEGNRNKEHNNWFTVQCLPFGEWSSATLVQGAARIELTA